MSKNIDSDTNLIKSEAKSLHELQRNLGRSLPKLAEHQLTKQGYIEYDHQITTFQLQNMKLKALPAIIKEFSRMRVIRLGNNNLETLDLDTFQNCSELRILDLGHNKLREIDLNPLQEFINLTSLILGSNQLQSIDLAPLKYCHQLRLLDLKHNNLHHINLDFLSQSTALWSLNLLDNPLTALDITPLLSLPKLELFSIDDTVSLEAFPVHRDYSKRLHWFVSEYLPRVKWIMTKEDTQYESLFGMYQTIVNHFRHDEFWADYRDRRLAHPPQPSDESSFFEYAVQRYLTIKDRKRTKKYNENAERQDIRTPWRTKITTQLQDQFVNALDLASALRQYWEPGFEPRITVNLLEGTPLEGIPPEVIVLHFWLGHEPNQLLRVSTFTWMRISVDEDTRSYQVRLGFNRGYLREGKKYHPIPPPEEFPSDVFSTTEVMYEIKSFITSNALDIVTRGQEWLKQGYYPKFDPEWPEAIYEGGLIQMGF